LKPTQPLSALGQELPLRLIVLQFARQGCSSN